MVTIPGIVAAFAAPAVMLGAKNLDRRIMLWILSAILVVSNTVVALAPNLTILLIGRVMLGVAVGAFWAISSMIAVKIVPQDSVGRASSIIFAGISVGTVVGVPAGALIGAAYGWRAAFGGIAFFGILVLATQIILLPRLRPSQTVTIAHLVSLFRIPKARLGLLATLLAFVSHFGAYTYMGAFLEYVTLTPPAVLSALLVGYGVAGFIGNFISGTGSQRNPRLTLAISALLIGVPVILLPACGQSEIPASILVLVWGFAFGMLPVALQGWMMDAAPTEMESASAMFVAILQFGLASGALLGGIAVDHVGLSTTLIGSGTIAIVTALIVWMSGQTKTAAISAPA
jgi:predicted MFS family arabinose efflux permease